MSAGGRVQRDDVKAHLGDMFVAGPCRTLDPHTESLVADWLESGKPQSMAHVMRHHRHPVMHSSPEPQSTNPLARICARRE